LPRQSLHHRSRPSGLALRRQKASSGFVLLHAEQRFERGIPGRSSARAEHGACQSPPSDALKALNHLRVSLSSNVARHIDARGILSHPADVAVIKLDTTTNL